MAVHSSLLSQFALLKGLPPELLQQFAGLASLHAFNKRELVLEKQSTPSHICFLLEGRLQSIDFTLDGKEVCLYFIEPGQYFAELGTIDSQEHDEAIVANKRSQVLMIPATAMRQAIAERPEISAQILTALAAKIRRLGRQRQILSISSPLQRICAQLLLLAHPHHSYNTNSNASDVQILSDPPTHQELAMMTNLSRETVTRVFQVLLAQGIIVRTEQSVVAPKLSQFMQAANGTLDVAKHT
jgi:CRP/FNR family transcriptional regulator, cyclic AMP receptor protein